MIFVIAAQRWHSYSEPLERDIATYAVMGHEMNRGRHLYSDLWDNKPPGIHVTNWLMEKIVPYGPSEVYALGVLAAVLTLAGVYAAGSLFGSAAGLWAALFWTAFCSDALLQANQPNVEVFINVFLTAGFFFTLSAGMRMDRLVGAGVCFALASFYKPQAVLPGVLLLLALLFFQKGKERWKERVKLSLGLLFPSVLLWSGVFLCFKWTGQWDDFYGAVVLFNRYYVGDVAANLMEGLRGEWLFPRCTWFLAPLLLVIASAVFLTYRTYTKFWLLLAAFSAGIFLLIAMPAHFFNHYYQLWLPMTAVAGGWSIVLWNEKFKNKIGHISGAICLFLLVLYEAPNYSLNMEQLSLKKYDASFVITYRLADRIRGLLKPQETFFYLGDDTTFYFALPARPPSGMVYALPAFYGPLAPTLQSRLLRDLARTQPDLLMLDNLQFPDYYRHFLNRYVVWKLMPDNRQFVFLIRRGSELEKRTKRSR